ncbi:hypothetical protein HRG_012271 [Hirsutella rhossiliensis]
MQYYPIIIPHYPAYVRPPSRPSAGLHMRPATPALSKAALPSPCSLLRTPANPWLLPTSGTWGGRANRPPHTSNHTPALPTPFSINSCQSTSSSNSQKATGDNIRTTRLGLLPRHHQRRINGLNAKPIARIPLPLLLVLVTNSHPPHQVDPIHIYPTSPCPNGRLDTPHAMPIQLPTTAKKGALQYYHNLLLSFTLIRYCPPLLSTPRNDDTEGYYWAFFFRRLAHTNLTPSPPYSTSNPGCLLHPRPQKQMVETVRETLPAHSRMPPPLIYHLVSPTIAANTLPTSKKTCFIGCLPTSTLRNLLTPPR